MVLEVDSAFSIRPTTNFSDNEPAEKPPRENESRGFRQSRTAVVPKHRPTLMREEQHARTCTHTHADKKEGQRRSCQSAAFMGFIVCLAVFKAVQDSSAAAAGPSRLSSPPTFARPEQDSLPIDKPVFYYLFIF